MKQNIQSDYKCDLIHETYHCIAKNPVSGFIMVLK